MPERDPQEPLRQMLHHAREICDLVRAKDRSDLDDDRLLQLALVRLLEIIGEAARRVPEETRSSAPQIPWPQIVSLRNRLIHAYDAVDYEIVWQIVTADVPSLVCKLEALLDQT